MCIAATSPHKNGLKSIHSCVYRDNNGRENNLQDNTYLIAYSLPGTLVYIKYLYELYDVIPERCVYLNGHSVISVMKRCQKNSTNQCMEMTNGSRQQVLDGQSPGGDPNLLSNV